MLDVKNMFAVLCESLLALQPLINLKFFLHRLLLKACQQEAFSDEYRALMQQRPLQTNSKLLVLNPQLDEDGIIRSNSRLANPKMLPYDARYPTILPRKHIITQLIIKQEHEQGAHVCGTNHILSELSKR